MQKTRPESETGPAYPIASVNNALLLLLLFREQPRVRLTDACKYLGVAHSTAHGLLAMLAHHGFVQQEPVTRAYIAGPALVEVGAGRRRLAERSRAGPTCNGELAAETGETVISARWRAPKVRYVDGLDPNRAPACVARTGTLAPAHCTSLGKALLAQMTDEQVPSCTPHQQSRSRRVPNRSVTTQAKLLKEVGRARARGYAVNSGEIEEDVGSVAVAFRDFAGRPRCDRGGGAGESASAQRISRIGELMIETISRTPMSPGAAHAPSTEDRGRALRAPDAAVTNMTTASSANAAPTPHTPDTARLPRG